MTFGDIIMKYRKELGLTQEALANQLGVTNQAVSKWESDQSCPDVALLPKIADLFGITIDQLFGREAHKAEATQELPWPDDGTLRVVLYAGRKRIGGACPAANEIHFCYEGPALNVHSEVCVNCGDVQGDVTAQGQVHCDAIYGKLEAAGDVNCDAVYGSVQAQGDVNCDDVAGSVDAAGDVTCDDVAGDVRAGGNVECECVDGDLHAGGDVSCDEAGGSITAGGSVHCDHWEG